MSEHRRRSPGKRRAARRNGALLPVTATAVTAVTGIAIAGYLVTMFNKSLGIHAAYDHQLRALYGDQVFRATVPLAKDFKEAVAARQPVASYKPRSAAAKAIKAVADELLERVEAASSHPAEFLYLGHRVGPKDLAIEAGADVDLEIEPVEEVVR